MTLITVKVMMLNTDVTEGNQAVMTDHAAIDGPGTPGKNGVLLQVKALSIPADTGKKIVSDISFHIEPGELVALTGVSYSGKSALLRALAGLLPPDSGEILIDGVNLYTNLKAFRSSIGFVPAEFSLPHNLTVAEVLQDGATLRLPRRTSERDRQQRVQTLLETIGLTEQVDRRVGSLSRIDKRRLSIAIELMGYPGLLLLDAPAEQLTPFEEVQITLLLKELSRQGLTIIQVDQRARSAGLADQIIFLAPGGLLAWSGPADEAFTYLRKLVPRGVVKDLFGLKEALEILANPQLQDGIEWARQFRDDEAYQKYVEDPLNNRYPDLLLQTRPLLRLRLRNSSQEKLPPPIIPRANAIQKFFLLLRRNARLLWRERTVYAMLVVPLLISLVDFVFAFAARSAPERAPSIFGMLVFLVMLTSGLLVGNEISKERAVYRIENRTKTLLFPYVLSKVWLVGILAIYQGLVWTIMHGLTTGMAGGPPVLLSFGITISLVSLIGGILGLIVSAMSKRTMTATNWLLLFTVPQLIFSGAVLPAPNLNPLFRLLSGVNPSQYALEALLTPSVSGAGILIALLADWLVLVVMSLFLIALLLGTQRERETKDISD